MKNLIEEIEKLKFEPINEFTHSRTIGFNEGINECIRTLNQYNIITAPKSVKLSEIVDGLNEIYEPNIYFNKELNAIGYGEYDKMWFMDTWTSIALIKNNKISKILKITSEETKWLYELWIAGTEIVDDLKEKE